MSPITLDMGAYAAFVWPAWGISALALSVVVARTLLAARRWTRALKAEEGLSSASSSPKGGKPTS